MGFTAWWQVSRRQWLVPAAALGLLVTGCSSGAPASPSASTPRPSLSTSPVLAALPACSAGADPEQLLAPSKLPGPASPAVRAGRVVQGWSVDDGGLSVTPPAANEQPVLSERQAACNLLAAVAPNGGTVSDMLSTGSVLGFGRLTVSSKVPHNDLYIGMQTQHLRPAVYQNRPAWILTLRYERVYSCPAEITPTGAPRPSATPVRAHSWFYIVFAVDAVTGRDSVTYVEAAPGGCVAGLVEPPDSTVPYERVSLPWRSLAVDPGGASGTIEVLASSCDAFEPGSGWVSQSGPELEVAGRRPLGGTCAPATWKSLPVHPATLTQTIPAKLSHAGVGPIDRPFG
jgi:hypothetical protein